MAGKPPAAARCPVLWCSHVISDRCPMKIFATSAIITLATAASAFAGCAYHKQQQAMSCAEGTVYDTETRSCVPLTTG